MNGKKLYRNVHDQKISGVCSGLADYMDFDVTIIRLVWAFLTLFTGFFPGVALYIIGVIIIPTNNGGGSDDDINGSCKEL